MLNMLNRKNIEEWKEKILKNQVIVDSNCYQIQIMKKKNNNYI